MYLIGIDEAGRGPVLGPMVMGAAVIKTGEDDFYRNMGVKDSKKILPKKRESLFTLLKDKVLLKSIKIIPAEKIDYFLLNSILNLNQIELETTAENEREKIVDIKRELKEMKLEASSVLEKYEKAINEIVLSNPIESPKVEEKEAAESIQVDGPVTEAATWGSDTEAAKDEESDDFFG